MAVKPPRQAVPRRTVHLDAVGGAVLLSVVFVLLASAVTVVGTIHPWFVGVAR